MALLPFTHKQVVPASLSVVETAEMEYCNNKHIRVCVVHIPKKIIGVCSKKADYLALVKLPPFNATAYKQVVLTSLSVVETAEIE